MITNDKRISVSTKENGCGKERDKEKEKERERKKTRKETNE